MSDPDLEAIRRRKLNELLGDTPTGAAAGDDPGAPIEVTDATIEEVLGDHDRFLLDIWAPWCGPCRAIAPMLEDLAREFQGQVTIGKLNADENPAVPQALGVRGIPTMVLFQEAHEVDRIVGMVPRDQLRERLSRISR